jgi:beta-phosphoglucomutase-like phosphatase (HAD superfamily)
MLLESRFSAENSLKEYELYLFDMDGTLVNSEPLKGLALAQLDITPQNTLVFEDSYAGVQAGLRSGCDVIAIGHDFNGKNDLSGALKLITSYDEML